MEISKAEVAAVEQVVVESKITLKELAELHLATMCIGTGDVILE